MKIMMPKMEASRLNQEYQRAGRILEFGTGGSTCLASELGKTVFSVESDRNWADQVASVSGAKIHYVDIGPTKDLGYPADRSQIHKWIDYPMNVWERNDFEHPDLILVDGRFRVACFLVAAMRIRKPTRVLFDDFHRAEYQVVSRLFPAKEMCGRLAVFDLEPFRFEPELLSLLRANLFKCI
jgi:protein O-GlcNAc transferase